MSSIRCADNAHINQGIAINPPQAQLQTAALRALTSQYSTEPITPRALTKRSNTRQPDKLSIGMSMFNSLVEFTVAGK
jgi:hypothetical protein